MLDLKSRKEAIAEVKPFFAPVTAEKNDVTALPFDAQLMAAADEIERVEPGLVARSEIDFLT